MLCISDYVTAKQLFMYLNERQRRLYGYFKAAGPFLTRNSWYLAVN